MKKPLRHKSKLQTILAIGRPMIILALALVTAVSIIRPAHAQGWEEILILIAIWTAIAGTLATLAWTFRAQVITGVALTTAKIILGLIQILIGILQPLLLTIATAIIGFGLGTPNFLLEQSSINEVWKIALGIANAAFLLVLLIASIAIILRVSTGIYNLKKFLSGFIQAIILANFSLIIVRAMVALGDKLTQVVIDMADSLGVVLPAITGAPNSANTPGAVAVYFIQMLSMHINVDVGKKWSTYSLIIPIAEAAIFITTAWIIIKFGLILIERMVRLFAAAVIAPLIFAGSLLPNFQKIATQWWENTIKWILVLPITMAFLIIALMFFAKAGIHTPADMANINTTLLPDFIRDAIEVYSKGGTPLAPQVDAVKDLAYALMGLFVLWTAGMVSNKLDIKSVMGGLVETPQKALALGQRAYKTAADTLTGKNLPGKIGKAGFAGLGALRRQAAAGSFSMLPGGKRLQEIVVAQEAKRQRTTAGLLGMIFNPKGRGGKLEVEAGKGVAAKASTLDIQDTNAKLKPLNDAVAASATHPGRRWNDLTKQEQIDFIANSGTDKARLEDANKHYKDAYNTTMWRAREEAKKTDMLDWDPVNSLGSDVKTGTTDPTKLGDGVHSAVKLSRIAASKNHPERKQAKEMLENLRGTLMDSYGIDPRRLIKQAEEDVGATDSASYTELYALQDQLDQDNADLDYNTAAYLATSGKDRLRDSKNSSDTINKQSLTNLGTALQPNSAADIQSLTAGTSVQDIVDDVARKDLTSAKSRLANHGITDTTAQDEIIKRARTMKADDLKIQLGLVASEKAGSNLDNLIRTIERLQSNKPTIEQITNNQIDIKNNSSANYNMIVNNTLNKPGGATIYDHAGTSIPVADSTQRNLVDANAQEWIGRLKDFMLANPNVINGDNTLAQIKKAAQDAPLAYKMDINQLTKTLENLGLNPILGSKISIDEALERLKIIT